MCILPPLPTGASSDDAVLNGGDVRSEVEVEEGEYRLVSKDDEDDEEDEE